jgi:hypothetical protein
VGRRPELLSKQVVLVRGLRFCGSGL